jgi:hypothetical protein
MLQSAATIPMLRGVGLLQLRANLVGKIHLPKACANLTFGGLLITRCTCARAMSAFRARNGPHQASPDGPGARRDHLFWRNSSDPAPEQHQCRPPPPLPRDEATKLNN